MIFLFHDFCVWPFAKTLWIYIWRLKRMCIMVKGSKNKNKNYRNAYYDRRRNPRRYNRYRYMDVIETSLVWNVSGLKRSPKGGGSKAENSFPAVDTRLLAPNQSKWEELCLCRYRTTQCGPAYNQGEKHTATSP